LERKTPDNLPTDGPFPPMKSFGRGVDVRGKKKGGRGEKKKSKKSPGAKRGFFERGGPPPKKPKKKKKKKKKKNSERFTTRAGGPMGEGGDAMKRLKEKCAIWKWGKRPRGGGKGKNRALICRKNRADINFS